MNDLCHVSLGFKGGFTKPCLRFILVLLAFCLMPGPIHAQKIQEVSLQLKWKHQFQFAGYYAAIEKGFYREAGIHVNLIEAVEGRNPGDAVFEGKAQFGVCASDIVLMRAQHKNAVVLATVFQHSPLVLLASKQSGIEHVQDLAGKRIAMEPNAAEIIAFMADEGISPEKYTVDQHAFTADMLLNGELDAISAYLTDEPFVLNQKGFDFTVISPAMGGIDFYGDVLFTTGDFILANPELADNFRKASLKGWKYAMKNPDEIVNLIYNKYSKRHSVEHLNFEAARMKHLIMADVVEPGYTNPGRWESIALTFKKMKMLDASFTTQGLLYADYVKPKTGIPWKLTAIFLLIIVAIGSAAYFFYYTSRKLKNEIQNRLRIEKDLMQSEALYRSILAASPDAIFTTEIQDGRYLMVSPGALRMFGCEHESDMLGHPVTEFITPDDRERALSNVSQISEGHAIGSMEYRGLRADGSSFDFEENIECIPDDEGQPAVMVSIARDITNRKRAQAALNESEEKHRILFVNSPDAYLIIIDGIYVDCNQAAGLMLQTDRTQIVGRSPWELSPEYQPDGKKSSLAAREKMDEALAAGSSTYEWVHRRPAGSDFFVEVSMASMILDGKQALFATWRNITGRKRTEAALRESEALYKAILNASPDGITITDMQGRVLMVSPATLAMFGYQADSELLGHAFTEFFVPDDRERSVTNISHRMKGALTGSTDYQALRADGSTFGIEVNGGVIPGPDGLPAQIIFIGRDSTERKNAELEIKLKNRELQKINGEKDKFFSIIAHDLRSPFNGFLGLTQIMAEELSTLSMSEIQTMALSMRDSATQLFRLLKNLLEWSRMQQGLIPFNPVEVLLFPLVDESMAMMLGAAQIKGIEMTIDIPQGLAVFADTHMLQTVIRNLTSNAIKFTPKHGRIHISARIAANNSIEISVKDTGIGMSKTMLGNLFRPDIQTNRKGTGGESSTGLGLLLCSEFIGKHKGSIWAVSTTGEGSTFCFALPARDYPEQVTPIQKASNTGNHLPRNLKILIADDDKASELLLSAVLKAYSSDIWLTSTGGETVEACLSHPDIDLILMDIKMAGMDGYEATRQIRKFNRKVIIIAQTAYGLNDDREKALKAGCNYYFSKPIDIAGLKAAILTSFGTLAETRQNGS